MDHAPAKPVVIYDGGCNICAGNLKWLYRFDTFRKFEAMPYQTERLTEIFPGLKIEDCQQSMHLVFPSGKIYTGSDAFREVFLENAVHVSCRHGDVAAAGSVDAAAFVSSACPQSLPHRWVLPIASNETE